jgi:hypothetical protein
MHRRLSSNPAMFRYSRAALVTWSNSIRLIFRDRVIDFPAGL